MTDDLVTFLESELRTVAARLTSPRHGECSLCYTERMLEAVGCDGTLRWVDQYVRFLAPTVQGFHRRLRRHGAFCDCEVFFNAYQISPLAPRLDAMVRNFSGGQCERRCWGARRGSTKPCLVWTEISV